MELKSTLTLDQLKPLIAKGRVVLLFTATWCGDCHFLEPHLPEIEKDFPNIKFYNIDRDGAMDVAKELGIFGIPSLVVYQDGQEIGRLVNKERKTKQEVEDFLHSLN